MVSQLKHLGQGKREAKNGCNNGLKYYVFEEGGSVLGYELNRSQVDILAGELAVKLGRKGTDVKLSNNWHYGFLNRRKDRLSVMKPRSLTSTRAECFTKDRVDKYFDEVDATLEKYDLKSKPHLIYNIDETGLQSEHRPVSVISSKAGKLQAITSPKSATTTLIGCVNAVGNSLPPFLVFKGKRLNPELLNGSSPGTGYGIRVFKWNSFPKKTGISPFNRNAVPDEKFIPSESFINKRTGGKQVKIERSALKYQDVGRYTGTISTKINK
ncbi:hypothetical protein KUTeg_016964 [Tegillarca granosa]|uniref:HTH CENPB-type domain-containing protein n=1 Tax=Tegillarca granosa TaxID=220873 RepID=A0ABQ9ENA7_TEGGR|nr:hypothetical protein KUTeg_016964 [Tegillarca granosa]